MKARSLVPRLALASLLALVCADARAVRRTEDPIALVPADAVTVGVLHWNELKKTPLGERVLANLDHMSGDDDAARFFRETGLTPSEDIDTIVVAMVPGSGRAESGLVMFEGRFDLARISKALTSRGAALQSSPTGDFYLLPNRGGEEGAVALVNKNLIVCGGQDVVTAALARRENGGEGGLGAGLGLGRQLSRVDRDASAWALVDLTRFPKHDMHAGDGGSSQDGQPAREGEPARAVMGAMRSVSLLAVQTTVRGDGLDFQATGVAGSTDDRQNLEDALKGVLAMWRMAVQDKSPDLVSVIRRFQVESDGDAVTIRGSLPGTFLRILESKKAQK
jgi:hypothetical protein